MTKWQLPQGVEYPIRIFVIQAKAAVSKRVDSLEMDIPCKDLDALESVIYLYGFEDSHSIRINNSIDLVKIEE